MADNVLDPEAAVEAVETLKSGVESLSNPGALATETDVKYASGEAKELKEEFQEYGNDLPKEPGYAEIEGEMEQLNQEMEEVTAAYEQQLGLLPAEVPITAETAPRAEPESEVQQGEVAVAEAEPEPEIVEEEAVQTIGAELPEHSEVGPELSGEAPPEVLQGEVVFHNGEWLVNDISPETMEWLDGNWEEWKAEQAADPNNPEHDRNGTKIHETDDQQYTQARQENTFNAEFTPEEKQQAEGFYNTAFSSASVNGYNGEHASAQGMEELGKNEQNRELAELVLRVSVKVGARLAVIIARNLAKEADSKEARILLRSLADVIEDGAKVLDKKFETKSRSRVDTAVNAAEVPQPETPTIAPEEVEVATPEE